MTRQLDNHMNKHVLGIAVTEIYLYLSLGGAAIFGSTAAYLRKVKDGRDFSLGLYLTNCFLAITVAMLFHLVIHGFIPPLVNTRWELALMILVGISADKIFDFVEHRGASYFIAWLDKKIEKVVANDASDVKKDDED